MRQRALRRNLLVLLATASAGAWPGGAAAEPVSGPHGTLDNQFTTRQPNAPSGFSFEARYHAAGDPNGLPPYMRKMIFYRPRGLRYDTSVPDRCSASAIELGTSGPAACPPGSRLGGGTTETIFMDLFPSTVKIDVFNNTNEQIFLVHSPGQFTVARGRMNPDGSVEFASPTCFPAPPTGCSVDTVRQIASKITVAPYTRSSGGVTRSYLTTPPTCPAAGHWKAPIRLWWADGSVDTVVTKQPCTRPSSTPRPRRPARRRGRHTGRRQGRQTARQHGRQTARQERRQTTRGN